MKKTLLLFALIFLSTIVNAQVDRSIGGSQYANGPIKEQKVDYVAKSVELLTKKVGLDDLQAAMTKLYIEENFKKIEGIMDDSKFNYVEKDAEIEKLQAKLNENILEILTPEQKVKYEKLISKKK